MLGALIGAGTSILGGLMADNRADKANAAARENALRQEALQREFAQNGIQWRAADAEKAGISKLYALGANTASYSPVSVGHTASSGLASGLATAGQNIGRAVDATASPLGRAGHFATEMAQTQLDGAKLDNDIKRAELLSKVATRTQPGQPPAILNSETTPFIPGQGNSGIKLENKFPPSDPDRPQKEWGVTPEVRMYRTKHGFSPEVPQELGEAHESQPLAAAQWFMRNKLMPGLSEAYRTYPHDAPPGTYWTFNPVFGEYVLNKRPSANSWSWRDFMPSTRTIPYGDR
ncbi:MAG: DNA pilot protein [Arizlama microvirus]|nr:MAG: DNA pilot protein [Arizlama microvirus]